MMLRLQLLLSKRRDNFLGPCLSSKYPRGICINPNPKKYPPAKSPKSPANKLNSEVNNGDKVAVIALNRQDIK